VKFDLHRRFSSACALASTSSAGIGFTTPESSSRLRRRASSSQAGSTPRVRRTVELLHQRAQETLLLVRLQPSNLPLDFRNGTCDPIDLLLGEIIIALLICGADARRFRQPAPVSRSEEQRCRINQSLRARAARCLADFLRRSAASGQKRALIAMNFAPASSHSRGIVRVGACTKAATFVRSRMNGLRITFGSQ
jgi:hypothetical protein